MAEQPQRERPLYWLGLVWGGAFWAFAAFIASLMLWMSVRNRVRGGALVNLALAAYAAIWMFTVTAHLIAFWKGRNLSSQRFGSLWREVRPVDEDARGAWWWRRATVYGLSAVFACLALGIVLGSALSCFATR